MGLPLPLATCLSWVGPPSNLGGGSARAVFLLVSQIPTLEPWTLNHAKKTHTRLPLSRPPSRAPSALRVSWNLVESDFWAILGGANRFSGLGSLVLGDFR